MSEPKEPIREPEYQESLNALLESLSNLEQLGLPSTAKDHLVKARQHAEELGQALHDANQKYLEASQARAKFVSVVTHELRLPLTSIKGYTDLIRQGIVGPVNDQQKNFLGIVRSNVERMTALISDLADMSHAQSGRIKLNLKPVHLKEIIDELLITFQPKFDEKKQVFRAMVPSNLGQLMVDQGRLTQILTTILGNALRYTPEEGKIGLQAEERDGFLRIQVSDTGCGISPEDQEKLFTPFFRSEDEAIREHPGWGLALYVAKLLVGLMGGEIGATSEFRKGSVFWFTIPISPPE